MKISTLHMMTVPMLLLTLSVGSDASAAPSSIDAPAIQAVGFSIQFDLGNQKNARDYGYRQHRRQPRYGRRAPMNKASLNTIVLLAALVVPAVSQANSPADLTDLEIAHVAYTADSIDIRYAHLALAISKDAKVRAFAQTMIRDHARVNEEALAIAAKLNVQPQDNFLSQQLNEQAEQIITEMSQLSGSQFDRRYASNELGYHQAVNGLVEDTFIPNLRNPELKALFQDAIIVFKVHQKHAEKMVASLGM